MLFSCHLLFTTIIGYQKGNAHQKLFTVDVTDCKKNPWKFTWLVQFRWFDSGVTWQLGHGWYSIEKFYSPESTGAWWNDKCIPNGIHSFTFRSVTDRYFAETYYYDGVSRSF